MPSAKLSRQQLLGFRSISTASGGSTLVRRNSAKIGTPIPPPPPPAPPPPPKLKVAKSGRSPEQPEDK
jgi:hypothetical protein